jgi:dihydrofolate reductase
MAKVVVVNHLTLDGVMQAPARADEDTRDGFAHGGWAIPGNDQVMIAKIGERMREDGALLLGRRTYEVFHAVWPKRADNPFTEALTNARKYVASRTLAEPLPWSNSILLNGEAAD